MDSVEVTDKQDLTQLRAATSLMMTHFINGHHYPRLVHMIMQRLQQLLAHPSTEQITGSREIYVQLLEHWQTIYNNLLTQNEARLYFVKNSYTPPVKYEENEVAIMSNFKHKIRHAEDRLYRTSN
jgi:hypothetical protein